jgi:MtrB/PioB family decaheme-associated outer membrane protein
MNGRSIAALLSAFVIFLAPAALHAAENEFAEDSEEQTEDQAEDQAQEQAGDQAQEQAGDQAQEQAGDQRLVISGDVEAGAQVVDVTHDSSKFNEYKKDVDGLYLYRLHLGVDDPGTGRFVDFIGSRLFRDDQEIFLEFGSFGAPESDSFRGWSVDVSWNEIPHLLSNSARTPYEYLGGGRYQVAEDIVNAIQISNIEHAASWTAPDAGPGLPGEDLRIASVLAGAVRPIDLGTERETGVFGFNLLFSEQTQGRLEFGIDDKEGSILTGVGIGDRPPRSVNVQIPEPIDYKTRNFRFSLAHRGGVYEIDASYLYSDFENDVESLTWNSLFHAPGFFTDGATDYDGIRIPGSTLYATNGAVALNPDNTYSNFVLNGGLNLPWRSRLSASVAYGVMKQDDALFPYATSDFGGRQTPAALPRDSADARIETAMFNVVYTVNPLRRVNLKFNYRYYDLDNQTDQDIWRGNTSDSSSRNFKSERINIAYDLEQENFGADLSYYLGKAGSLAFAYEREEKKRPQREVEQTDEDIYEITYRVRPVNWASLLAKYTRRERDGSLYNSEVTDQSYAYDPFARQAEPDNPLPGFSNHPALRKFDVADREQDQIDLSLGFVAADSVSINLRYNYGTSDYRSDIPSTINTWDAATLAFVDTFVDPTQLGLLEDETTLYALDLNYAPSDRLSLSGFVSREEFDIDQRGRFLDENNRLNATAGTIATQTKDWQDTSGKYIWDADIEDDTNTVGAGVDYTATNDRFNIGAGFSHSRGKVSIDYFAGASIAEDDTTSIKNYAEWSSPPDASFKTNTLTLDIGYELTESWSLGFRYLFEIYRVDDWQQQGAGVHQNLLNENFVADQDPETAGTSQDRPGSRLVLLDDLLAPDYDAHVGLITARYRW